MKISRIKIPPSQVDTIFGMSSFVSYEAFIELEPIVVSNDTAH